MTQRASSATILIATVRGPMASSRVAGFCRKGHDERTDYTMGDCCGAVDRGLGVRGEAAVSRGGTGTAIGTPASMDGNMGREAGA